MVLATVNFGCAARQPTLDDPTSRSGSAQIQDFQPESDSSATGPPRLVIPPSALKRPLPEYPEPALDEEIACTARLLYHVEASGAVKLVRLEWDVPPPPHHLAAFEASISEAISHWDYTPAVRIGVMKQPDGSVKSTYTTIPKAQHSLIRFRVVEGRGVVD